MPNQLSKSKRRQSLAEHELVLALLAELAKGEGTSVMDLLRQATRDLLKRRLADPRRAQDFHHLVEELAPKMPAHFKSAAQVARFKRTQREFDELVLELGLASPLAVQERNSVIQSRRSIRLIDFDHAHASIAI